MVIRKTVHGRPRYSSSAQHYRRHVRGVPASLTTGFSGTRNRKIHPLVQSPIATSDLSRDKTPPPAGYPPGGAVMIQSPEVGQNVLVLESAKCCYWICQRDRVRKSQRNGVFVETTAATDRTRPVDLLGWYLVAIQT